MNIAVVFAGGTGKRMNTKEKPKQFLMVHGKPIIVHTIELFQYHEQIDGIVVSCIEEWIPYMKEMKERFRLDKISRIVPGGKTGQLSIYNGLVAAEEAYGTDRNIVLIHDGVRPLIDSATITQNIESVKKHGSTITCKLPKETLIILGEDGTVDNVPSRKDSRLAVAPQSFWLKEILEVERRAIKEGEIDAIDSCTLMRRFGAKMNIVIGNIDNIKITTPEDFYIFRALYDARENQQIEW